MKTNLFKKIIAAVLALSVVTIPSLSFAEAELEAPVDIASFNFLGNVSVGAFDTIEGLNNHFKNKTTAMIESAGSKELAVSVTQNNWLTTTSVDGANGDSTKMNVVFANPVKTGKVTMNWAVYGEQYSGRNLIVNNTTVAGLGNATANYYLSQATGFNFDTTQSNITTNTYGTFYTKNNGSYGEVPLTVVAYRESTSDTWAVEGYAKDTLLFQGTLPAEDLRSFGVTHYLTAANQTTKIMKLTATHEALVQPETPPTYENEQLFSFSAPAVADGTYVGAAALNAVLSGNKASFADNGVATTYTKSGNWLYITPTEGSGTTKTDVVFDGQGINTGEVTFKYSTFKSARNDKNFTINGTTVFKSANLTPGWYITQASGFPFNTIDGFTGTAYGETYYKKTQGDIVTVNVVASRGDALSTWAVKGYVGDVEVFTGTLPAEPITKFGITYGQHSIDGLQVYELSATYTGDELPEESDDPVLPDDPDIETTEETVLCETNFSGIEQKDYTTSTELDTALNLEGATVVGNDAIPTTYKVDAQGVKLTGPQYDGPMYLNLQLDKPVEAGEVKFDYAITNGVNGTEIKVNNTTVIMTAHHNTYGNRVVPATSFPFETGISNPYHAEVNGQIKVSVVVSRDTMLEDWTVKVYDSAETLLAQGTLPAATNATLTKFGVSRYWGDAYPYYVRVCSLKATLSANGPLKSVKVVNAAGTTIEDLTEGGNIKCVVDVKQPGGILYAAIYSSGYKLLAVKSLNVTEAGEKELPFENVAADATQHMKLFYWSNQFKPLIGFMDPLNPMN